MTGAFVFGPFRLLPARRELLAHGVPLTLGQRAFDVLLVLVARHGDLVTKDELMAEVWPGVVVEENNLQVHVSALRKVLSAVGDGQRYLVTVAGRGYRFVAPVTRESAAEPDHLRGSAGDVVAGAGRPPARAGNLPRQLTSLIGREGSLAEMKACLATHRLVTLTGSGGVGKTRLAIATGNLVLDGYADGVWLAELAPITDPQLVTSIVADALGVSLGAPDAAVETLISTLEHKELLLIIDNCEHVIAEVAQVAEALMRKCGRLSILASSRERLAIPAEYVIRVPSLPVPRAGDALTAASAREFAAVHLFAERANALGSGFALTSSNVEAIASICRRLDGIPLAIELAVPRLRVMSAQQLERALDERFHILTAGSRTALPRQQTLHALLEWSYDLLTDAEKLLLSRVSIFSGGASVASIIAVTASAEIPQEQIPDLLLSLAEKSLVLADLGNEETRYQLLESTRYFAREKLGHSPNLARRHAEHFVNRFTDATAAWETTATQQWLGRYGGDIDNLRSALEWAFARKGDVALGLDLVGRSHVMWAEIGLMLEHRRWVDEALAKVGERTPSDVSARLLSWQAGDVREIDDPADYIDALRAASLFRKIGDRFFEGRALLRAGMCRLLPDSAQESERTLRKAYDLLYPSGPTKTLARCMSALASALLFAGDATAARSMHEQAIGIHRALGETEQEDR